MNEKYKDYLRVGVITQTHGIRGEVKVFPTTDDVKRFDKLKKCSLIKADQALDLEVGQVKYFKQYVILKFKGFDNINDIEPYVKADLMVSRENAVKLEEGEHFVADLIGLKIVSEEGNLIGELEDVLETAAGKLLQIKSTEGKEVLIPDVKEFVKEVDLKEGVIKIHLIDGLLD